MTAPRTADAPDPDDGVLVARAREGNLFAFEEIVRRHQRRVYGTAMRIVRRHDLADDVAQETFVRAWRRLDQYDAGRPFAPWMCRIAANLAVNHVRSPSPARRSCPRGTRRRPREPPRPSIACSTRRRGPSSTGRWPPCSPEQRAVFVLRTFEDLSYKEIAETLGISTGTVMSRLWRARERLREALASLPRESGGAARGGEPGMSHPLDRLSAFLDGELPPDERASVAAHLAACPGCTARLAELVAVDALAREVPVEAPPGYFEVLPGRVRARVRPGRRRALPPVWTWAAAAGVLLAVLVPVTLERGREVTVPQAVPMAAAPPTTAGPPTPRATVQAAPVAEEAKLRARPERRASKAEAPEDQAPAEKRKDRRQAGFAPPALADRGSDVAAPPPAATVPVAPAATEQGRAESAPEPAPAGAVAARNAAKTAVGALGVERAAAGERAPATAADARREREAWRARAGTAATASEADEARVRVVELGAAAFRLGGDPLDRARAQQDGAAYLAREDAAQKARVQRVLDELVTRR